MQGVVVAVALVLMREMTMMMMRRRMVRGRTENSGALLGPQDTHTPPLSLSQR
jgi:hypothetical protein